MSALVFLDTETTGLRPDDEVWEVAAVRREPNGSTQTWIMQVRHDLDKAAHLPEPFLGDHERRYRAELAISTRQLAIGIAAIFAVPEGTPYGHRPHVVGCVPNFDTEHLARILRANGHDVPWHHHLIDVETLAVGWISALQYPPGGPFEARPPWDSDELSRAVGVEPPGDGVRHTAMGDVRWAMAIYDRVMGAQ